MIYKVNYIDQEGLVPILEGFEKDPGDKLVVSVEIRNTPIPVLQKIFKDDLMIGGLPIAKKYEKRFYEKTGIKIDTSKLDFFISIVREC